MRNGVILAARVDRTLQNRLGRQHADDVVTCYVDPTKLLQLAEIRGLTPEDVFRQYLPTHAHLKSGDFGEMLMWRLLQERGDRPRFPLFRWRTRQSRNDTVRGTDLVGYVRAPEGPSSNDVLVLCEVKTRAATRKRTIVREAYDGARKAFVSRLADQLLFQQHGLLAQGDHDEAMALQRFANPHQAGALFKTRLVAAVVHDEDLWNDDCLEQLPPRHRLKADVEVLLVHAADLRAWIKRTRRAAIRHAAALSAVDA